MGIDTVLLRCCWLADTAVTDNHHVGYKYPGAVVAVAGSSMGVPPARPDEHLGPIALLPLVVGPGRANMCGSHYNQLPVSTLPVG